MIVLFWASVALVVETYLVFPSAVLVRARLRSVPHLDGPVTPTVTVVVAARDEEPVIADKLRSVLATDYPSDRLDVVVASDGSTDGTVEAATDLDDDRITVLDLGRVGKAGALNAAIARATGSVVVFTDANSRFVTTTLRELVRPFADPDVGGVAGDQRYETDHPSSTDRNGAAADGERRYWDLDRRLKAAESIGGNVIGATGALYAVRRHLIGPVPDGVTDDFTTSTGVIEQGHRLVFAPAAAVYEPVAGTVDAEFRRKVRVMTRGLRAVAHRRVLLDPTRHGFYAYQLVNHKVLRRLMALPLVALLVSSASCRRRGPLYRLALGGQLAIYGPAAIGLLTPSSRVGRTRACGLPAYFCMVNAAGAVATFNLLTGRRIDQWQPDRGSVEPDVPAVVS